jgi:hypothetical protein
MPFGLSIINNAKDIVETNKFINEILKQLVDQGSIIIDLKKRIEILEKKEELIYSSRYQIEA